MDTFEIAIQRRDGEGWPVIVEQSGPGSLTPERSEGRLELDDEALRALELSPEAYGRALGEALFADSVRDAFRRALSRSEERLRVLLFIEDVELRAVRWERLCAPIDDGWPILALSQRAPFSRYLPSLSDRRFPQIGRQDLRALIVAASPANMARFRLEPFDVAEAVGGVRRSLDGIPTGLLSDLPDSAGPPSLDAICAQISAEPFTLLHIVCHGRVMPDGQSVIFLARDDDPSEVDPVTATRLIERLSGLQGARGLPRLTFLSTCESASPGADAALGGLAQRLVRELGMPAVVAMTDKVQIATANALSAAFYARLRDHGEVDRALVEASSGLAERGTILVPALFSRLGGQPLFSESLGRPLGPDDIAAGLSLLGPLVGERAPVLVGELDAAAAVVRRTLRADPGGLTREARQERDAALAVVDAICAEATELSFRALALGQSPPAYDARCPFPGLRSFRADARAFFFGREPLVARLIERLAAHPFLAVLGASGSGKSSLVFAGLLPALQARDPQLSAVSFTPGQRPLEAMEVALAGPGDAPRIVVVDQFEEAFTICQDKAQREAFFAALLALADTTPVVITMRADFLGEVAPYAALRDRVQSRQELVAPMTPEELRRAMELQAAAVGLRFEADLGGQILDDVRGEPGAMPLLQHALQELWQRRRGRWLRGAEYRNVGGIQQAIAHSADQIHDACAPADRERLRAIFVRLTRLDRDALAGEERRDTRQRVSLRDLTPAGADPAPLRDLLRRLADARLVVTGVGAEGEETVEVAHEALIRSWPRLRAWLEEDRASLLLRDSIRLASLEWQREEADPALLFRGGRLDEALALSQLPRFAPNELERSFLDASLALREQEAAEREAVRQRELEQARALADEQARRAEEQAAAAVRLRRRAVFLAGVAGVAVLAMVAAVFLGLQAQSSERAAEASAAEANQRALVANAQAAQSQGLPSLALALTLAAADSAVLLPATTSLLTSLAENAAYRQIKIDAPSQLGNVSFSPRGDELFVTTASQVQIWGANGDTPTRLLDLDMEKIDTSGVAPSPREGIQKALISPDGTTVVATTSYSLVSWGLAGMLSYQKDLGEMVPYDVAFLPDSHSVALLVPGSGPVIFDLHSRTIVRTLVAPDTSPAPPPKAIAMAVSPDGFYLAVAYTGTDLSADSGGTMFIDDGTGQDASKAPARIIIWNLADAAAGPMLMINAVVMPGLLAFDPGGVRLAAAYPDETVHIWDITGLDLLTIKQDSITTALAFSSTTGDLVTGTERGVVQVWNSLTGGEIRRFSPDHVRSFDGEEDVVLFGSSSDNFPIGSVAFDPSKAAIVATAGEKTVYFWDLRGYETAKDAWPEGRLTAFARFSAAGDALVGASGGLSRIAPDSQAAASRQLVDGQVFDVTADEQRAVIFQPGPEQGVAVQVGEEEQIAPNPEPVPGKVGIWDIAGGGVTMVDTPARVVMASFAPDGEVFLSFLQGGLVQIRDGHSAALQREFVLGGDGAIAVSPNFRQIIFAEGKAGYGFDCPSQDIVSLTLWDVASGTQIGEIAGQRAVSCSLAYSHDGTMLAVGYADFTIRIWRTGDGELVRTLAGHSGNVTALAFSADGKLLLSGGADGAIWLWDLSTGEALRGFKSLFYGITKVALSPDASRLLASGESGITADTTIMWRNDSGAALTEWVRANRYVAELSCAERARYKVVPLCAAEPTPAP